VLLQAETEPDDLNDENEVEATAPSLYPDLDGSVSGGSGDYRPTSSVKDDTGSAEIDIPGMEEEEPLLSVESEVEPSTAKPTAPATPPVEPSEAPAASSTPLMVPSAPTGSSEPDQRSDDTASAKSTDF